MPARFLVATSALLLGLTHCGSVEPAAQPPEVGADTGLDVASEDATRADDGIDAAFDARGDASGDSFDGDPAKGCLPSDWPTAKTAGIPPGTPALTVIAASRRTTKDGEVFDAVDLRARLYVDHKNVVIKRSRLTGDEHYAVYTTIPEPHLTIEDSEITSGLLVGDHFTGRRNHLHAPAGGTKNDGYVFEASNVLLEDNLIDGLVGSPGAHLDGVQVMGGTNIVIRHNWIEAKSPPISGGGVNAAIFLSPSFSPIANVVIECNMLIEKDGYYPLRINSKVPIVVRKNRWQRGHLGAPVHNSGDPVTIWADNAYVDGEVIARP